MGRYRTLVHGVAVWAGFVGLLGLAPHPVAAEGFFDIYLGAAFPQTGDVDTSADDPIVADMIAYSSEVEWETSPSSGIRGGYWFEAPGLSFLGIALDLSYYRAFEENDFASLDVYALPMTPLLMLRLPLGASEEFPGGRVQPYGAIGPGLTLAFAHADTDELRDNFSGFDTRLDDFNATTFDVGLDARGGLAIQVARNLALYGEYRYTYVEPEFDDDVDAFDTLGPFETEIEFEPELETHHLVFGVSFRF